MNTAISAIGTYGPMVVTAAAAAMAILPQGKPGSVWGTICTGVNWLAFNWGNAKNQVKQ